MKARKTNRLDTQKHSKTGYIGRRINRQAEKQQAGKHWRAGKIGSQPRTEACSMQDGVVHE
jgi:hypothetical protein